MVCACSANLLASRLPLCLRSPWVSDDFSPKQILAAFWESGLLRWYTVIVVHIFMVGILFGFLPVYVNPPGYDQLWNGMIVTAATTSYLLIQPRVSCGSYDSGGLDIAELGVRLD